MGKVVLPRANHVPWGRVDHPSQLRLPSNENEFRYGGEDNEVYNASAHFGPQEVCEERAAGSHYMLYNRADVNHCELCPAGFVQPHAGEPECLPCLAGNYTDTQGQTACLGCALCPEGQFRRGCGRHLRDSEGVWESCQIE